MELADPIKLGRLLWPDVAFYRQQREIVYSVEENDETYVPAGNMLGKDFVAGFVVLNLFLRALKAGLTCRIVTTSVKEDHLRVLWGEVGRFLTTAKYPLLVQRGGPLVVNHMEMRRASEQDAKNPINYLIGAVSKEGEGLAGHHAEVTLAVADEASGVDDKAYKMFQGWARRMLIIGNPNPCQNFFFRGVKAGVKRAEGNGHLYSNVIRIKAEDSPSVQLGLAQKERGLPITDERLVPGVLTYGDYAKRRATWDAVRQCIGLDGEFYEGGENLLFPPDWLNRAEARALELKGTRRVAKAIGIDPGEGRADTADYVVDELGVIARVVRKTPDTSQITGQAIALVREYGVAPENVLFDRGGGGKQHADRLREQGYPVRTVAFGESVSPELKRGIMPLTARKEQIEERYVYRNRRAQMYGLLSLRLDPLNEGGFAIPAEYQELRRQLAVMPRLYDAEGRLYLPPKNKRSEGSTEKTITEMLGCSPDEADALVLAVFGVFGPKVKRVVVG